MNTTARTTTALIAITATGVLALAGCGSSADETPTTATDETAITMTDAWVKSADEGMSAAFGVIENESDEAVTVTSVSTPASTMVELHETVENDAGVMTMREIEGGFVIEPGASLTLEPGADHIMLMDLTKPLVAGETVEFTVTLADESTYVFSAPVKDFTGANEVYESDMEHGDMNHDDSDDDSHDDMDH